MDTISKRYGRVKAVSDLTIEIEQGEIVSILGPNGAGKSTLLKMLSLQSKPSSGRLKLFGQEPPKQETKRRIGYLAHESFLYGELTVLENLKFYQKMFANSRESSKDTLIELIESLAIERWLHVRAENLSHGSRKRADIARALIHGPDLLTLDEPLSGLDPQGLELVINNIANRDLGRTTLLSLQDIELARKFCDRAIVLKDGKIIDERSFR
jgi:ABC-type multidrug transport system ATPase subunit